MRPAYITATRSAKPAMTLRSWVIITIAAPVTSRAVRSTSRTWAWIVTSSAVVGSSAMITSGSLAIAIAIITRWRMPPENSCGKASARSAACGMPTSVEQLDAPLARRLPRDVVVDADGLGELVADRVDRRERRQRVLEDHRDALAADLRHPRVVEADQLLAVELDRAVDDGVRRAAAR